MRRFDLPIVPAHISVNTALKTAIDAKRSGVVLKTRSGGLRLVNYKDLVGASRNKTAFNQVDFIPILDVGRGKTLKLQVDTVKSAGMKFGYRGANDQIADLLSVQQDFANRYVAASTGARCSRPGKPPGLPAQKWYHYYPPLRRDAEHPDRCRRCGAKIL